VKWFKHYSDNYRGRSVGRFYKDFGHSGVSWYYLLTEICAEKLEKSPSRDLAGTDCSFSFDVAFVQSSLRGTLVKIERWLSVGQALGLWTYKLTETELSVNYPILLELLDSDSRKSRSRRETDAIKTRLDKDIDKEREEIKKENLPTTKKPKPNPLNSQVWESYKSAYFNRYKVEPVRNAKVNSNISQIASRLGVEAIEVVKFYLTHNDSFYLKNLHAVSLCLKDCESLRTQMVRGRAVTSNDVRNFEKQQNVYELTKAIRDGENF
jgi:hypothetical protein